MIDASPDSIIAPWLEAAAPRSLWIVGPSIPPVVMDYCQAHGTAHQILDDASMAATTDPIPEAAILVEPIVDADQLSAAGILKNRLIGHVLCFADAQFPVGAFYGLAFESGATCFARGRALLSFQYALATYNHTRAWNNPKFWANPEHWNKHWW